MMKKSVFVVVLFVLCAAATTNLFAWGQKGHDVITAIAQANLSRHARKQISHILSGRSIVFYSSWMDNTRNSPYWEGGYERTRTWHFANIDEGYDYATMPKEANGDVLTATHFLVEQLRDSELNDSTRCDYLKMLIHVVGDMHCPMHAGRLSDRGGNNFQLSWFGQPTSLHTLWDSKLIESARRWSYTEWCEHLNCYNGRQRKAVVAGSYESWLNETVDLAEHIYTDVQPGDKLSYGYLLAYEPLLMEQLTKAGYRLAAVLNEIF